MTHYNLEKTFQEFKERFAFMTDSGLIKVFNREVDGHGWVSARGAYLVALQEEISKRDFDNSAVGGKNQAFPGKRKIKLEGKKILFVDEKEQRLKS